MTIHEREGRAWSPAGQLVDDDDRLCFMIPEYPTLPLLPCRSKLSVSAIYLVITVKKKNTSSVFFVTYNCIKKRE